MIFELIKDNSKKLFLVRTKWSFRVLIYVLMGCLARVSMDFGSLAWRIRGVVFVSDVLGWEVAVNLSHSHARGLKTVS